MFSLFLSSHKAMHNTKSAKFAILIAIGASVIVSIFAAITGVSRVKFFVTWDLRLGCFLDEISEY